MFNLKTAYSFKDVAMELIIFIQEFKEILEIDFHLINYCLLQYTCLYINPCTHSGKFSLGLSLFLSLDILGMTHLIWWLHCDLQQTRNVAYVYNTQLLLIDNDWYNIIYKVFYTSIIVIVTQTINKQDAIRHNQLTKYLLISNFWLEDSSAAHLNYDHTKLKKIHKVEVPQYWLKYHTTKLIAEPGEICNIHVCEKNWNIPRIEVPQYRCVLSKCWLLRSTWYIWSIHPKNFPH